MPLNHLASSSMAYLAIASGSPEARHYKRRLRLTRFTSTLRTERLLVLCAPNSSDPLHRSAARIFNRRAQDAPASEQHRYTLEWLDGDIFSSRPLQDGSQPDLLIKCTPIQTASVARRLS